MVSTSSYTVMTEFTDETGQMVTVGTVLDLTEDEAGKLKDLVELTSTANPGEEPAPTEEAKIIRGPAGPTIPITDAYPEAPVEPPADVPVEPTPEAPVAPTEEPKAEETAKPWAGNHKV